MAAAEAAKLAPWDSVTHLTRCQCFHASSSSAFSDKIRGEHSLVRSLQRYSCIFTREARLSSMLFCARLLSILREEKSGVALTSTYSWQMCTFKVNNCTLPGSRGPRGKLNSGRPGWTAIITLLGHNESKQLFAALQPRRLISAGISSCSSIHSVVNLA